MTYLSKITETILCSFLKNIRVSIENEGISDIFPYIIKALSDTDHGCSVCR